MPIDPLNPRLSGFRILSDRGIHQALQHGLIRVTPELREEQIQPATIDMCFHASEVDGPAGEKGEGFIFPDKQDPNTLYSGFVHDVQLTQHLLFPYNKLLDAVYLTPTHELRSSLRRLGVVEHHPGMYFLHYNGKKPVVKVTNLSPNNISIPQEERIVQFFIRVNPFPMSEQLDGRTELGDLVRSLDMGLPLEDPHLVAALHGKEYTITPKLTLRRGFIVVHASEKAYRFRIMGTIDFSQRQELQPEHILEPVNISKGYHIQPGEHLIVETQERLDLSPSIGILFIDNPLFHLVAGISPREVNDNMELVSLSDGWVDPGYKGTFSRQPKWLTAGRYIEPGTPLGWGLLHYFPNGTMRSYGSPKLASQYQHQEGTQFAEKS